MKNTHNKLTCLFGFHDYSGDFIRDKGQHLVQVCKICKRSGYFKYADGIETWRDYNEEGNCMRQKWSDGAECWWSRGREGNEGNEVYKRWVKGPYF